MSSYTDYLLGQWGEWQNNRPGTECKSAMLAVMRLVTPAGCASVQISDDTALDVDRAVARLRMHDSAMYELLRMRYVNRMAVAMIAKQLGNDRRVIDRRLAGAVAWIDACLNFFAENRQKPLQFGAAGW